MDETSLNGIRGAFDQLLAGPTTRGLWELHKDLLALGDGTAAARAVVRAFHAYLQNLESKTASRSASRWGAALGTAAVGGVSLQELQQQDGSLGRLLDVGAPKLLEVAVPALLEVGAAVKSAEAWEVEARLMYDDVAWFLWDELWDVSAASGTHLSPEERRAQIDTLLAPVLDAAVADARKAPLIVHLFLAALAARVAPLPEWPVAS